MKKLLAALLCLVMLFSVLVACDNTTSPAPNEGNDDPNNTQPEENPGDDNGKETVTLADYRIVYPKGASAAVRDAAKKLESAMKALGVDVTAVTDDANDKSNVDYEILVGKTNRVASSTYLESAAKNAYTVRPAGNKIVVCGGVDFLTESAVNEFIALYVKAESLTAFAVSGAVDKTEELSVKVIENGTTDYSIVYDKSLAFLKDQVKTLRDEIKDATGVTMTYKFFPTTINPDDKYIILGMANADGVGLLKDSLTIGGWSIAVSGNKIYVAGTDEDTYEKAIAAVGDLFSANKSGNNVTLTRGETKTGEHTFLKKLPHADGYSDIIRKSGNGDQYVAVFSQTTMEVFESWKNALAADGYELYNSSEFHGEDAKTKNYFVTYVADRLVVRLQYHTFQGRMYLIAEAKGAGTILPPTTVSEYQAAGDKYPTMLTQFGISDILYKEASMCYILRVADGSFVIIDSHGNWGSGNNTAAHRIYNILRLQAPDPNNIVISAWFLTHAHGDHHGGFLKFAELFSNKVTLKAVYYNFPADEAQGEGASGMINSQREFVAAANKFTGVQHIRPHTGDILYFADVKFQVMYSQVDHMAYEAKFNNSNAMSLVLRLVTADGKTVLFGADHPVSTDAATWKACEGAIYKWYGSFIESDVVSTFHHGLGGGADIKVYQMINPSIVLWCQNIYRTNLNDLHKVTYNKWFLENKNITTLLADDNVQTLTFGGEEIVIAQYDSFNDYASNKPLVGDAAEAWRGQLDG